MGPPPGVTLLNQAVGASPGVALLHISRRTPTVSTLSTDWARRIEAAPSFAGVSWDRCTTVEVTTLDFLIGRHGLPAFCKIDVEGFEAEVLHGLSRPLPCLSFEFHPATPEIGLLCVDRLADLGAYEYNWSVGETHRWGLRAWASPSRMRAFLKELSPGSRSRDVYARFLPGPSSGI